MNSADNYEVHHPDKRAVTLTTELRSLDAMPGASLTADAHSLALGRRRGLGVVLRMAAVLGAGAVVVGAVAAVALAWWLGLFAAAVVGAGCWFGLVAPRIADADERVLRLVGPSRPADAVAEARLLNLIEGLAPAVGLPRPRCHVIEDQAVNALALGRDPRHGCVVLTSGLLLGLSRMELEAVVAHTLVRLCDGATIAPTLALSLGGGRRLRPDLAAPADLGAVSLTRYPPGLSSALRKVASGGPAAPAGSSPLLAPLWLAPPGDAAAVAVRVQALDEM